jgi:hypothetical protein
MDLDKQNHHACSLLKVLGLRRVLAREVARRPATHEAVQNQLMTASTAGDTFRAAPGMHITNNDKFIDDERNKKEENIEQMTKDNHFLEEQMEREE